MQMMRKCLQAQYQDFSFYYQSAQSFQKRLIENVPNIFNLKQANKIVFFLLQIFATAHPYAICFYFFSLLILTKLQKFSRDFIFFNCRMFKKPHSIDHHQHKGFNQDDSKCICQICTCQQHKCPHANVNIPFQQISTYQKQYVKHPLNSTQKMSTDNSKYPIKQYGYIASSYQQSYPGHKPKMTEKIVPRVKNQNRDIPFQGQSWYKSTYQYQNVVKDKLRNKDKEFNPDQQPFMGLTTYNSSYFPKRPQSQLRKDSQVINYPEGYRFTPNTTYSSDFLEKKYTSVQKFKPIDRVAPKGKHYLNSTYRDDFTQKHSSSICPVLTLPRCTQQIHYPNQHMRFNKTSGIWQESR